MSTKSEDKSRKKRRIEFDRKITVCETGQEVLEAIELKEDFVVSPSITELELGCMFCNCVLFGGNASLNLLLMELIPFTIIEFTAF